MARSIWFRNGASQAIVDARKLGRAFVDHGLTEKALGSYENEMLPVARNIILANRANKGPDAVMQLIEDRCGGMRGGRALKAFIPGGSSAPVLPADKVDTPADFESVAAAGGRR